MIPARAWFANYQRDWFAADVAAGLTAAAVVIPKAMAYATVAGGNVNRLAGSRFGGGGGHEERHGYSPG